MKDDWRLTNKHACQRMDFHANDVFLYEKFRSEYMGISDSGLMCVNLSKVYHKFEKMKEEIDRLKERSDILSKYDIDGSYSNLRKKYDDLREAYVGLADIPAKLNLLQRECNELRGKNASLENIKERYDSLRKKYSDLELNVGSLEEEVQTLRASNLHLVHYANALRGEGSHLKVEDIVVGSKAKLRIHNVEGLKKEHKKLKEENEKLKYKINLLECKVKMRDSLLWPKDADELLESVGDKGLTTMKEGVSLTECLINEGVSKYNMIRELISLVFSIAGVVMSWNHGPIYLLLFLPVLIVRLLPSEETVKMILMDYYKRKDNDQNGKH